MTDRPTYAELERRIRRLERADKGRRAAAAALARTQTDYRAVFDAANDAIVIHDPLNGRILDANRRMSEMYGYTREEILRLDVEAVSEGRPPYSQAEALVHVGRAAAGAPQLFEWRGRKKNGETFWVEVNLKRVVLDGVYRLLAVVRDIDERKRAEAAYRRAQQLASLGEMAARVAHEINNPINGVINYAQILADEAAAAGTDGDIAARIIREGERVAAIVRNLLVFTRERHCAKHPPTWRGRSPKPSPAWTLSSGRTPCGWKSRCRTTRPSCWPTPKRSSRSSSTC